MWTRKELKEKAKVRFKASYWKTVLVSLIVILLIGGANIGGVVSNRAPASTNHNMEDVVIDATEAPSSTDVAGIIVMGIIAILIFLVVFAICFLIQAFIINPIMVGCSKYFVSNLDRDTEVKEVLSPFDRNYKNGVKIMFFRDLYTLLWSLLFIIPGIIKSYEYRMIPYLLAENPEMSKEMAFSLSKQMMQDNKWRAFVLDLSFILWHILAVLTGGILEIFYVAPYVNMTKAALYATLKDNYQQAQAQVEYNE